MLMQIEDKVKLIPKGDEALVPIAALLEVNNRLFSIVNNSNQAIKDLMDRLVKAETNAFAKKVKKFEKPLVHRIK